ncbi:polysaccharide deacetylase family protein [Marinimicrobium sp. ABcell2]|uniref:polysaccharide deacetylase family protein n=1 Tax=Marinimicrobium sp. ABcell2 TaxID=3069751 RepID=UPI0027B35555|nr:polysaccharide deacetylase family protein [Marinimicrobium sp. ABcell2]MDQ2076163.1 polysaccharide deacetylase family protein [Marinimicrobium sp. ABcell2]
MNTFMRWAITNRGLETYFSSLMGSYVTVFMLHRAEPADKSFHGISEALLERCLRYAVENGYDFMSVDEVVDCAIQRKKVSRPTLCFTLDDGYADQVSRLVPVLLRYRAKPTIFAITDFIDGLDWPWDAKLAYAVKHSPLTECELEVEGTSTHLDLSTPEARIRSRRFITSHVKSQRSEYLSDYMAAVESACQVKIPVDAPEDYCAATWDELRASESQGLKIGSHTRSHTVLSALDDQRVAAELAHSKRRLSEELTNPSQVFCYPSGTKRDFSRSHEKLVKAANYQGAVSTISQTSYLRAIRQNPYRVARIAFPTQFDQFVRYSSWFEALRSKLPI